MFVKIADHFNEVSEYVNTDHIQWLIVTSRPGVTRITQPRSLEAIGYVSQIHLTNGENKEIPHDVARYLVTLLDADEAYVSSEQLTAQPRTLSSRVAEILRDDYIAGASVGQLEAALHADDGTLNDAIQALIAEGIVTSVTEDAQINGPVFFHVVNLKWAERAETEVTSSPDLLDAYAAPLNSDSLPDDKVPDDKVQT